MSERSGGMVVVTGMARGDTHMDRRRRRRQGLATCVIGVTGDHYAESKSSRRRSDVFRVGILQMIAPHDAPSTPSSIQLRPTASSTCIMQPNPGEHNPILHVKPNPMCALISLRKVFQAAASCMVFLKRADFNGFFVHKTNSQLSRNFYDEPM